MSLVIEAGDVLGVQGCGPLSDAIRLATGNSRFSHIALVTATAPIVQVTEALSRVRVRSLEDRLADATHVWLLKPNLPPFKREAAVRAALTFVGDDYGYSDIIWQALDALSQSRYFTEHFVRITRDPICSMLASISEPDDYLRSESCTPADFETAGAFFNWPEEQLK